jgi:hypothetical protein
LALTLGSSTIVFPFVLILKKGRELLLIGISWIISVSSEITSDLEQLTAKKSSAVVTPHFKVIIYGSIF